MIELEYVSCCNVGCEAAPQDKDLWHTNYHVRRQVRELSKLSYYFVRHVGRTISGSRNLRLEYHHVMRGVLRLFRDVRSPH